MKARSSAGALVYSTDGGRMCPACRKPLAACDCTRPVRPRGDGVVRVSRETKGRGGKGVTLVKGLALDDAALAELSKQLKTVCGCGGTVRQGVLEVQGAHGERIMVYLQGLGYQVKRSGA